MFRMFWLVPLLLIGFAPSAYAQTRDASLSPGFKPDPTELRGIAGGAVAARDIAQQSDTSTGPCVGFIDGEPNHTLQLNGYFSYLDVQVQSGEDSTIVVKGPGGIWCNDDAVEKDAGISGEWLAGSYQVWVGGYTKDRAIPYTLRISTDR